MIKYIDKEFCKEDLIQVEEKADQNIIICDSDILYLKSNNDILINKYLKSDKKYLFPFKTRENDLTYKDFEGKQIYEYNKLYLIFGTNNIGFYFSYKYFFKGNDRAICLKGPLDIDERKLENNIKYLDRKQIENYFNSSQYDSMYILYDGGTIYYAKSLNDGIVIDGRVIPTDEEIIEEEFKNRKARKKLAYSLINGKELSDEMIERKAIDDINELNIYGPILFRQYSHLFITSKNGKFTVQWYKLDYVENNKFRLTTSDIFIPNLTVDNIIEEIQNKYKMEIRTLKEKIENKEKSLQEEQSISLKYSEKPKLLQRLFTSK